MVPGIVGSEKVVMSVAIVSISLPFISRSKIEDPLNAVMIDAASLISAP